MENESHTGKSFNIEDCRAANSIKDWVDCLSPEQARFCGFSLLFGNGYFCKHPRQYEIVEMTKKSRSKLRPSADVSQSDTQE